VQEARKSAMEDPGKSQLTIWRNARLATLDPRRPGLGIIERGAVAASGGEIVFVGEEGDVAVAGGAETVDCEGRWITPGLIDCHTHLVHAGTRADEFEMRLAGASYAEISAAGGGIVSSVRALRAAGEDRLAEESLRRLDALIAEGVTMVEIKSGYGLDLENEAKSLRVARQLGQAREVTVCTSFLGAHALPPEAGGDKDAYIRVLVEEMLPQIAAAGLADAVDAFCEGIAFSPAQVARVFEAARALGLPVKLHADQLSNLGGAALAARFGALSADHLEHTDEIGTVALARAGTVAVLLPGAYYFLRETTKPPVDLFRRHGVSMAVATDCNPGTSPLTSMLLAMNMAATLYSMTVDEIIGGVTRQAARALGLAGKTGTLERGKWADFVIWNIDSPAELVYRMGFNPLYRRIRRGR
jgi:imidazolonepropionase